ncbi:MAG TPA: hypothetical protein VHB47_08865 [Thermoanaerobaculia bacterium]|jgi:hypothetical protein|nr:hypothetical protein [Thermoanaerobaculia bacterium]
MSLASALQADRDRRIEAAADLYEAVLSEQPTSLVALVNLAVLYWRATECGFSAGLGLDLALIARAGRRLPQVLAEARQLHPQSTEVRFWERYIAWADLGEPFAIEECEALLRHAPSVLVPAMYLFAISHGERYEKEARDLLRECLEDQTVRARYIASVIEGVLKRAAWSRFHSRPQPRT